MEKARLIDSKIHGDYKEVAEDYWYQDIKVPAGFLTDGASVPKCLQWVLDPFDEKYATASVVHDYLYYSHLKTKTESDKIFLDIMLKMGTSYIEAKTFYYAVTVFGGLYY
jgi:hypothetical protein